MSWGYDWWHHSREVGCAHRWYRIFYMSGVLHLLFVISELSLPYSCTVLLWRRGCAQPYRALVAAADAAVAAVTTAAAAAIVNPPLHLIFAVGILTMTKQFGTCGTVPATEAAITGESGNATRRLRSLLSAFVRAESSAIRHGSDGAMVEVAGTQPQAKKKGKCESFVCPWI